MAQSATPATQNPTSRHNGGTASQLRKRVRVTDEEDFRVTDEGLSFGQGATGFVTSPPTTDPEPRPPGRIFGQGLKRSS